MPLKLPGAPFCEILISTGFPNGESYEMPSSVSAVFMTCALMLTARAQTKPDFSGAWKMNLEKSKLSDGQPIPYYAEFTQEIDHREPKLRIVEKIKDSQGSSRTVEWNVTTDGKEYETKVADSPAKVSARWDGDRLVGQIRWGSGKETYLVTRKYALSADSQTATAAWEITTPDGSQSGTEIWKKK